MLRCVTKSTADRLGITDFSSGQQASFDLAAAYAAEEIGNVQAVKTFVRTYTSFFISALFQRDSLFAQILTDVYGTAASYKDADLGFSIDPKDGFLISEISVASTYIGFAVELWLIASRSSRLRQDDFTYSMLLRRECPAPIKGIPGVGFFKTGWGANWDTSKDEKSIFVTNGKTRAVGPLQRHGISVQTAHQILQITSIPAIKAHAAVPFCPWYISIIMASLAVRAVWNARKSRRISEQATYIRNPSDTVASHGYPGTKFNWKLFAGQPQVLQRSNGLLYEPSPGKTLYQHTAEAFRKITTEQDSLQFYIVRDSFATYVQNGFQNPVSTLNYVPLSELDSAKWVEFISDMDSLVPRKFSPAGISALYSKILFAIGASADAISSSSPIFAEAIVAPFPTDSLPSAPPAEPRPLILRHPSLMGLNSDGVYSLKIPNPYLSN